MHGVSAVSNDPNAVRKMYADIVGLEQAMKRVDVSPGMLSWAACGCFKGQWSFDDVYICLSCLATQMPMAGEPKSSSTAGPGAALILASEKFGTLAGPGKALLKYRPLRHTHTHKIPNSSGFSIFFSSCQLPISCQEWEEQEIPWAELIWVLVFHRSFGRRSWFVHIGPWCQWMHQVDPFEGCLKQTCLEMKTCKDHEGHISGHEMTYEFTWLMCLEDIVIHALYIYI